MKIYRIKDTEQPSLCQFYATKAEAKLAGVNWGKPHEIETLEVEAGRAGLRQFCEYLWADALMECDKTPPPVRRPTAERMREEY